MEAAVSADVSVASSAFGVSFVSDVSDVSAVAAAAVSTVSVVFVSSAASSEAGTAVSDGASDEVSDAASEAFVCGALFLRLSLDSQCVSRHLTGLIAQCGENFRQLISATAHD